MPKFRLTGSDRKVLEALRDGAEVRQSGEKTWKLVYATRPGKSYNVGSADCWHMNVSGLFKFVGSALVARAGLCNFYTVSEAGLAALEAGHYGY